MKKRTIHTSHSSLSLFIVAIGILVIGLLTAAAYVRNSIYQNHVTLWADVVKRSPLKRRAHENYGQALSTAGSIESNEAMAKKRYDEALEQFKIVIALKDDGSVPLRDLYREIGVVYFRLDRYTDATTAWQKGLDHEPNDASLLNNLSIVMLHTKQYQKAAEYAERALVAAPGMPQALNTMGQVSMMKKDYEKATTYFLMALEREPDNPQRYWNVSLASAHEGKFDMALHYATRYAALARDPVSLKRASGYIEYLKKIMKQPRGQQKVITVPGVQ